MEKYRKRYYGIDLLRIIACISVLFYHLNILPGGFLAVSMFFTLSGFLIVKSTFNKGEIKYKDYYSSKIKSIYLPILFVTLASVFVISLMPNANWFNFKPEVRSILLGFNNYWQLGANADYFARVISSPLTHLWFTSIILQFYLVAPFVFSLFKKCNEKIYKNSSILLITTLSVLSFYLFVRELLLGNTMTAYYGTLTRFFSLGFGVLVGILDNRKIKMLPDKFINSGFNKVVFYFYSILLISIFFVTKSVNAHMIFGMIITTILTCRLLVYAESMEDKHYKFSSLLSKLSKLCYGIYLVQYPVIFSFQNLDINYYLKLALIIAITFLLSFIIYLGTYTFEKKNDKKIYNYIFTIVILIFALLGCIKYITSKDYTKEMNALKEELANNQALIEEKKNEYAKKLSEEKENWNKVLEDFEKDEEKLGEYVKHLPIVGVGDSVMLGALNSLYKEFPNGLFDAAVSRTDWKANEILVNLKNKGLLGDVVVFNLGTNGECPQSCKNAIFNTIGNRKLFWVNATKPDYPSFNGNLKKLINGHDNFYLVDWVSVSKGHPEYLIADGIHLTSAGSKAYSKAIYDAIYNVYYNDLKEKHDNALLAHEEEEKKKVTFIGDDILLNVYNYLDDSIKASDFLTNKDYNALMSELQNRINDGSLSYNVFWVIDSSSPFSKVEYINVIKLLSEHNVYVLNLKNAFDEDYEGITVLDFNSILAENKNYIMADGKHLTESGNMALSEYISGTLGVPNGVNEADE